MTPGNSPVNRRASASIPTARRGGADRRRTVGRSEMPSMTRPGLARAASTSVGAKSTFDTWPRTVLPVGHARPAQDERHAQRLLVGQVLVARDAVLALQPAVVGDEDDQRVAQLPGAAQDRDEALDVVVDGPQRTGAALVVELELRDLRLGQRRRGVAHGRRLVAEVGLVEARRPRQLQPRARRGVARRGPRVVALAAHERRRDVLAVRRRGRPPDEEGLARPRLGGDEALGHLPGDVRRVVLRALRRPSRSTARGP